MRKQCHVRKRHSKTHWPPTQTSHDENAEEEGQAEPSQTWRVAEEHQKVAEDAEPDGLRHAERHEEPS